MNSLPHVEIIVTKESFNYVMGLRSRILIVVPALFYIASSHARYPAMTTPRTTIRYWLFLQPGESPSSQQSWWTNALPSIVSRVLLLTASFFLELPSFVWTEEEIGSVRSASDWSIVLWASSAFRHLAAIVLHPIALAALCLHFLRLGAFCSLLRARFSFFSCLCFLLFQSGRFFRWIMGTIL